MFSMGVVRCYCCRDARSYCFGCLLQIVHNFAPFSGDNLFFPVFSERGALMLILDSGKYAEAHRGSPCRRARGTGDCIDTIPADLVSSTPGRDRNILRKITSVFILFFAGKLRSQINTQKFKWVGALAFGAPHTCFVVFWLHSYQPIV